MAVINADEFSSLMKSIGYFEPNPSVAVAVSGGGDSMALLFLTQNWVEEHSGTLTALTVNHNLRKEAKKEALQVAKWCKEYKIKHEILNWNPPPEISSALQENARAARYRLLLEYCKKNNILHLLTAHHLDDQAETMFFRLARGSNIDGISAIPAQRIASGIRILRPLINIPKSKIIKTLENINQKWIEDPSNSNEKYSRVYIRKKLADLDNEKDIKKRAGKICNTIGRFRNRLAHETASEMVKTVEIYESGYAVINILEFNRLENEISQRILQAAVTTISGNQHPPRSYKLSSLHNKIKEGTLNKKYSLAGLIFELKKEHKIFIYREKKSVSPPCPVPPDEPIAWDNRFIVTCSYKNIFTNHIEVRALQREGISIIKKHNKNLLDDIKNRMPDNSIKILPSLWLLDELIGVPHIGYMNKNPVFSDIKTEIRFQPAKPLADSGFFVMNSLI